MGAILETFATLRVFSESISPAEISEILDTEPTHSYERDPDSKYRTMRETNYWGWSTKGKATPTDNLEHLGKIVSIFIGKAAALESLREAGCKTDICCYLVNTGQGGPDLDVATMKSLVRMGLPVWWDVTKGYESEI